MFQDRNGNDATDKRPKNAFLRFVFLQKKNEEKTVNESKRQSFQTNVEEERKSVNKTRNQTETYSNSDHRKQIRKREAKLSKVEEINSSINRVIVYRMQRAKKRSKQQHTSDQTTTTSIRVVVVISANECARAVVMSRTK